MSSYAFNDGATPDDYSDDSFSYSCASAASLLPVGVTCDTTLLPRQR